MARHRAAGQRLDRAADSQDEASEQQVVHLRSPFWWNTETCGGNAEVIQARETVHIRRPAGVFICFPNNFFGGAFGGRELGVSKIRLPLCQRLHPDKCRDKLVKKKHFEVDCFFCA